jgi:hypothetical protein
MKSKGIGSYRVSDIANAMYGLPTEREERALRDYISGRQEMSVSFFFEMVTALQCIGPLDVMQALQFIYEKRALYRAGFGGEDD